MASISTNLPQYVCWMNQAGLSQVTPSYYKLEEPTDLRQDPAEPLYLAFGRTSIEAINKARELLLGTI